MIALQSILVGRAPGMAQAVGLAGQNKEKHPVVDDNSYQDMIAS